MFLSDPQRQPVMVQNVQSFVGHIIFACFVFWCCNFLFGLIAFILAGTCHHHRHYHSNFCRTSYGSSVCMSVCPYLRHTRDS